MAKAPIEPLTAEQIREEAKLAAFHAGSRKAYAEQIGLSQAHLSEVLNAERPNLPDKLLDALGIEKIVTVTYRRKGKE